MIPKTSPTLSGAWLLPALLISAPALAQDNDLVDPEDIAEAAVANFQAAVTGEEADAEEEEEGGWEYALSLGANAARSSANSVPGVADGATVAIGVLLNGNANLNLGQSSWQNNLKIQHTQTRTPQIPQFYKSGDQFSFDSTYLFRVPQLEKVGPYARFKLDSQLFPGHFVSGAPVQLQVPVAASTLEDPETEVILLTANENGVYEYRDLTSPFEPLTLRFSVGAFANPIEKESVTVKTKLGIGAQEIITQGGVVQSGVIAAADRTDDDPLASEYDLVTFTEISGGLQAGSELGLDISGSFRENINYGVSALFFAPFAPDTNLLDPTQMDADTGEELYPDRRTDSRFLFNVNTDITANIGMKLSRFASLDFALSAKRSPLVTPDWQLQSSIMLSFAFNLVDSSAEDEAE